MVEEEEHITIIKMEKLVDLLVVAVLQMVVVVLLLPIHQYQETLPL